MPTFSLEMPILILGCSQTQLGPQYKMPQNKEAYDKSNTFFHHTSAWLDQACWKRPILWNIELLGEMRDSQGPAWSATTAAALLGKSWRGGRKSQYMVCVHHLVHSSTNIFFCSYHFILETVDYIPGSVNVGAKLWGWQMTRHIIAGEAFQFHSQASESPKQRWMVGGWTLKILWFLWVSNHLWLTVERVERSWYIKASNHSFTPDSPEQGRGDGKVSDLRCAATSRRRRRRRGTNRRRFQKGKLAGYPPAATCAPSVTYLW